MITNLETNKKYIGKKIFWSKTKIKPLKGKKRKRLKIKESDWQEYYGSNEELKDLVAKGTPSNFERKILYLAKSKGEMSYMETKFHFKFDVLLNDDFYNSFVGCKIHRNHVKNMVDKEIIE
jgi:hypothetical protein